jgi:toxin ParE1/3/4
VKKYTVIYSAGASEDIEDLGLYIAFESSAATSIRYIAKLLRECNSLALALFRGTKRPDLRPNMRIIGFQRAVTILFRIEEAKLLVVILGTAYRGRTIAHILARNE